ncbi:hypothetical protein CKAN_02077500 [Cinnamomum micranthum f. kanehirae]|uniref:Uncharacterized protein n=1 Tax=Cinnamomum micranthum f. kanehirae TaxID=337451 RepID=A0A3S3MX36_9MAGN|nr:hypothetical protein CKAN_02077500 [Cinnamomum micranthum f. kanehirae]
MEAGRKLFSSSPPPLHPPRKRPTSHLSPSAASPSSSVPVAHEQAAHAVTSLQTTAISGHFPASVLCREQRDDLGFLGTSRKIKHCRQYWIGGGWRMLFPLVKSRTVINITDI